MPADDALPIISLVALAAVKLWLSSDYFLVGMSRLQLAFLAWLEAGWLAGRARDGHVHGYVPALVCSQLVVNRRP